MRTGIHIGIPGGGGVFSPLSLPGCALWLRADLGITSPDAGIARWLDQSASLAHVSQDTAASKAARYSTVGHALDFDGVADKLEGAAWAGLGGAHTCGLAFQLLSDNTGGAAAKIPFSTGSPVANGFELQVSNGTPSLWRTFSWNAGSTIANWGSANTTPQTWVLRHDGAGGNADNQINGVDQGTLAQAQCLAPSVRAVLGGRTGSAYSDCRWWALIIYSDRKSDAVVANMTAYLTALRDGTTLPSWRPTDESNLVLWLERPDLWAGPSVSAWADQETGTAYDFAQAVAANQPKLITGDSTVPFVHFNGVSDYLSRAAIASWSAGYTAAVVANPEALTGTDVPLGAGDPGGADGWRIEYDSTPQIRVNHSGVAATGWTGMAAGRNRAIFRHSGGQANLNLNGTAYALGALAAETTPHTANDVIGARTSGAGAGQHSQCRIHEIAGYSADIGAAQAAALAAYLTGLHA